MYFWPPFSDPLRRAPPPPRSRCSIEVNSRFWSTGGRREPRRSRSAGWAPGTRHGSSPRARFGRRCPTAPTRWTSSWSSPGSTSCHPPIRTRLVAREPGRSAWSCAARASSRASRPASANRSRNTEPPRARGFSNAASRITSTFWDPPRIPVPGPPCPSLSRARERRRGPRWCSWATWRFALPGRRSRGRHHRIRAGDAVWDAWHDMEGRVLRVVDDSTGYSATRVARPSS